MILGSQEAKLLLQYCCACGMWKTSSYEEKNDQILLICLLSTETYEIWLWYSFLNGTCPPRQRQTEEDVASRCKVGHLWDITLGWVELCSRCQTEIDCSTI